MTTFEVSYKQRRLKEIDNEEKVNMKCPCCKRRIFYKKDLDYLNNTGRCYLCDMWIMFNVERGKQKDSFKSAMDLSQHSHIYN